jgi:hypothetical protein
MAESDRKQTPADSLRTVTLTITVIVIVGIPVLAACLPAAMSPFRNDLGLALVHAFGGVTLTALFVERFIEVFVSIWREPEEQKIEARIAALPNTDKSARELELEMQEFKGETGRIASSVGLVIGVLVAAAGFRAIESLLDAGALQQLAEWQRKALIGVDTLLTGAVLSGGSEAVHKIFNVYDSFMVASRSRAEAKAKPE